MAIGKGYYAVKIFGISRMHDPRNLPLTAFSECIAMKKDQLRSSKISFWSFIYVHIDIKLTFSLFS